jgi:hypothetical protein
VEERFQQILLTQLYSTILKHGMEQNGYLHHYHTPIRVRLVDIFVMQTILTHDEFVLSIPIQFPDLSEQMLHEQLSLDVENQ